MARGSISPGPVSGICTGRWTMTRGVGVGEAEPAPPLVIGCRKIMPGGVGDGVVRAPPLVIAFCGVGDGDLRGAIVTLLIILIGVGVGDLVRLFPVGVGFSLRGKKLIRSPRLNRLTSITRSTTTTISPRIKERTRLKLSMHG